MKIFRSRWATATAAAAVLSMTASPAMARGWDGYRHHHRGVNAGDIFAGLLIIGGIAAVASAASKGNRDKREREDRYPDSDYRDYREYPEYRERPGGYGGDQPRPAYPGGPVGDGWRSAGSMDAAVDRCVEEVERGELRVDSVDSVERQANGWRVSGTADTGREYRCTVDRDGQVRGLEFDGR